ncbi:unnamed protein product [Ceutorhynchus assimilis]|uniref:Uncharacterized protein n=1 Tax=Ceutorhynchus assimilis TaxID=467358 RepID=A0A9N9MHN1_9CUCU|nr:unnamed protein product [Ceutorhynchus assimilis]
MIALKLIPIAQILLILFTDLTLCYPSSFYNSKRLSHSIHRPSYDPYEYYARSQRYPYSYYPSYTQLYPDDYYYNQDSYPMYYLSPRPASYDYLPYYYQDVPGAKNTKYNNNNNNNNYYNYADLSTEEQERLLQEIEREQRERAQPIGHEIRYENDYNSDADASVDETNAAFLNNLMMQQMYQDSVINKDRITSAPSRLSDQYPYADFTADMPYWEDVPYDHPVNVDIDEDVKELEELPKKQKQRKNRQRKQRKQKIENISNENPSKRSQDDAVVYTDRKPIVKDVPTVSADTSIREARGQKEEVLMRPATPVRHPFSSSVLDMLSQQQKQEEKKRSTPSVYETIKHMLEMEKKYEESQTEPKSEIRPSMKKRIVSSEDSLTKQLSVLKKAQ